ncbi:hypothetical protein Gogos_003483 [Gossypium gossypioides]|uniref:RNase H type-1 domain-containing protein n=1 Tax=Gossypium gossypioides TaxID=34282 RepID=A0A7J9CMC6_GOSGO|nr:hypothetical protein [Gossypium gossypioides]
MALVHCVDMVLKIYFTFLGTTQLLERSGYVLCLPIFKGLLLSGGDVQEKWGMILRYNHYLGICLVFYAKLWEILDGLTLIQRRGYNNVLIYTNSLEFVKALQDIYLVELSLALMASERSTNVQVFDDILEELVIVLRADKTTKFLIMIA